MKVLIIGGTGHISTAITPLFIEAGHDVTLYNMGKHKSLFDGKVRQISGDRMNYPEFEKNLENESFDCVIDMICFRPEDALSDIRVFSGRVNHFIFASTVDVYTKPADSLPVYEDSSRIANPAFDYAHMKVECENLFMNAEKKGAFNLTILRMAAISGEGRGLVHSFEGGLYHIDRLLRGKPIIVHGDGSSIWVTCHRDDAARAYLGAAGNKKTFGKAYNISGDEFMTWNQYWTRAASALNAPKPTLVHIPTDVLLRYPDIDASWCGYNFQYNNMLDNSASKKDLGFRYTITWEENVRRVVGYLVERNMIPNSDENPVYDKILSSWNRYLESCGRELA